MFSHRLRAARASRAFSTTPTRHQGCCPRRWRRHRRFPSRGKRARLSDLYSAVSLSIGQPLSLLLKSEALVSNLSPYDIHGAPGVAADVRHIDSAGEVNGYAADKLDEALQGVEVVVIPAGVPRKPGMTRDDLFNTNASIVRDLATAVARNAPNPTSSSSPTRSTPSITTLDVVRASRFLSGIARTDPAQTPVTVVGGHSGVTIVPLLSQSSAGTAVEQGSEGWKALVHRIQYGGDEVVQAKDGAGSATLSMAYAAAKFTNLLLKALKGEAGIVIPTFVKSPLFAAQGIEFFSSAVELGPNGVKKIHDLGNITAQEQELVNAALPELKKNIEKGFAFAQ
ncbi:hypothetical protein M422DRAFT_271731 [Sphaerobolus stellatus SS14]|uniref:malate dehydrogenase n=1 Tax=Sphaerobolus stellatus (strain SS14) TaxID=990650 RepID=A0A0C9TZ54_SPHS4|nr:hypothetical protein M422DRAFT_271731 [Sphaerobolus stellatus SS14]